MVIIVLAAPQKNFSFTNVSCFGGTSFYFKEITFFVEDLF